MNSDKLDNINFLADEEPPLGHLQRFEEKLDYELHSKKVRLRIRLISVAAAVIVLIATGTFIVSKLKMQNTEPLLLVNYSPDLAETEKYYYSILNSKLETISEKQNIDKELKSDIKEFEESLKNISYDMKINPGDERLVDAFFGLYQTQIEALDNIIEHYNQLNI